MSSSGRQPAGGWHRPSVRTAGAALIVWLVVGLLPLGPAFAHGGDEHQQQVVVLAPRAEQRSGTFELVTIYTRDTLALFVSRYADGAPVTGAKVSADTDLENADMRETDPGLYVTRDLTISPGRNDVRFTINAGSVTQESQPMALLVPGGVPAFSKAAMPTSGRHNQAVLVGAVLAVYVVMTVIFIFAGRSTPAATAVSSRRLRWAKLTRPLTKVGAMVTRWARVTGRAVNSIPEQPAPSVVPVARRF